MAGPRCVLMCTARRGSQWQPGKVRRTWRKLWWGQSAASFLCCMQAVGLTGSTGQDGQCGTGAGRRWEARRTTKKNTRESNPPASPPPLARGASFLCAPPSLRSAVGCCCRGLLCSVQGRAPPPAFLCIPQPITCHQPALPQLLTTRCLQRPPRSDRFTSPPLTAGALAGSHRRRAGAAFWPLPAAGGWHDGRWDAAHGPSMPAGSRAHTQTHRLNARRNQLRAQGGRSCMSRCCRAAVTLELMH